jgi:phosphoglycolate phosphatase-like HAD superfamily hydrolase
MTPAYVLDMDGALLTLEIDIEDVRLRLAALFAPYGVTRPFRPILPRIHAAAREAAARGGDEARLRAEGLAILEAEELRGAASARARPGAPETVATLAEAGAPLGLYTSRARAAVAPALAAAGIDGSRFAHVGAREDAEPRPSPAGLLELLARLGRPEAWYVTAHAQDVETARAARERWPGLRIAAVGDRSLLERSAPDRLLGELRELHSSSL